MFQHTHASSPFVVGSVGGHASTLSWSLLASNDNMPPLSHAVLELMVISVQGCTRIPEFLSTHCFAVVPSCVLHFGGYAGDYVRECTVTCHVILVVCHARGQNASMYHHHYVVLCSMMFHGLFKSCEMAARLPSNHSLNVCACLEGGCTPYALPSVFSQIICVFPTNGFRCSV